MQITKKEIVIKIMNLLDDGLCEKINIEDQIKDLIKSYKLYKIEINKQREISKNSEKKDYIRISDLIRQLASIRKLKIGKCEDLFTTENKLRFERYIQLKTSFDRKYPKHPIVVKEYEKIVELLQEDIKKYNI